MDPVITYDTRLNGAAPLLFASILMGGYELIGSGAVGWAMVLRDINTNTLYPLDSGNGAESTLAITDGNGNPLTPSNTIYTGTNSTPQWAWTVKDPRNHSGPAAASFTFNYSQSGNVLGLARTVASTLVDIEVSYYLPQFLNFKFTQGYSVVNPRTFPIGLGLDDVGQPAGLQMFGYSPSVFDIDFGNNSAIPNAGKFTVFSNQSDEPPRRIELNPTVTPGVYQLAEESDGRNVPAGPQYSRKITPLGSDTATLSIYFGSSG